ncbi:hypothetical protein IQ268_16730 [Oculatella sp. LEGE 06141]|uniref:hypothetical protein n=1 Tax=Oculatella sp. LEGE 06141 TaxID=1828648 RepID=UPI00187F39E9|nr:hypothetical protein [Oculatella sp. LEGE 06141]MBE9180210.1 hypothetical protein [Oculatella sp. LEGE 06141]
MISSDQQQLLSLLDAYPEMQTEVAQALDLPSKEIGYRPETVEVFFEDVLVSIQDRHGSRDLEVPVDFQPKVIALYGDSELLLVQAEQQLILNRLPQSFESQWISYSRV